MYNHRNDSVADVTSSTRNKNTNCGHDMKSVIRKDWTACQWLKGEKVC